MRAYQTNKFEALIDGQKIVLGFLSAASVTNAIHKQGFNIALHVFEYRVHAHDIAPGLEREQRLGRSSRARIKRNNPLLQAALIEERHVDGNHQPIPLGIGHAEVSQKSHASRYSFKLPALLSAEENGACVA